MKRKMLHVRIGMGALVCAMFSAATAEAAVEAVQIRLIASLGQNLYQVPNGKVLIIEHVLFSNHWGSEGETRKLIIQNGGSSISGSLWDTDITYTSGFNGLLRPLKLPGAAAVGIPPVGESFQCFIYGLLADQTDLYAAIPSEFQELHLTSSGSSQLAGVLHTDSPRPKIVSLEGSTDVDTWSPVDDAMLSGTETKTDVRFELDASGEDTGFYRAVVHARMQELPPERSRGGP